MEEGEVGGASEEKVGRDVMEEEDFEEDAVNSFRCGVLRDDGAPGGRVGGSGGVGRGGSHRRVGCAMG